MGELSDWSFTEVSHFPPTCVLPSLIYQPAAEITCKPVRNTWQNTWPQAGWCVFSGWNMSHTDKQTQTSGGMLSLVRGFRRRAAGGGILQRSAHADIHGAGSVWQGLICKQIWRGNSVIEESVSPGCTFMIFHGKVCFHSARVGHDIKEVTYLSPLSLNYQYFADNMAAQQYTHTYKGHGFPWQQMRDNEDRL